MIDDPSELLEQFNTHFSKIADKLREKLPDLNIDLSRLTYFVNSRKDHDVVFTLRDITVTQVLSILKRVSPDKSAGIDEINARLRRLAAPVITLSIARIIDHAFSTAGNFPHRWKPLKLPLCSKKVMQATHLIIVQFLSSLSYLLKIIKRYVHDSLYDFFQVNNLIYYLVPRAFP